MPRELLEQLRLLAFHAVRAYGLHPLTQRGLSRVNRSVNRAARALLGRRSFVVRARDGRRFTVDPGEKQYQMGLLGLGVFEPGSTAAVRACLAPGDVVFDVGANFGWYTTLFSQLVGQSGRVHAFEPLPTTFDTLKANCGLNACANVTLNNFALSDASGEAELNFFPDMPHGNTSLFAPPGVRAVKTRVPLKTLDDYFDEHRLTQCHFIKCDAEGNEKAILEGGARVLAKLRPAIIIELCEGTSALAGHKPREILQTIARHGHYRFFRLNDTGKFTELDQIDRLELKGPSDYYDVLCLPDGSRLLATVT